MQASSQTTLSRPSLLQIISLPHSLLDAPARKVFIIRNRFFPLNECYLVGATIISYQEHSLRCNSSIKASQPPSRYIFPLSGIQHQQQQQMLQRITERTKREAINCSVCLVAFVRVVEVVLPLQERSGVLYSSISSARRGETHDQQHLIFQPIARSASIETFFIFNLLPSQFHSIDLCDLSSKKPSKHSVHRGTM